MDFKKLIDEHDLTSHPLAAKEALGDAYLLKNNSVFLNLRTRLLDLGFKLDSNVYWKDLYKTFPLLFLDKILSTKTIPYNSNALLLNGLVRELPNLDFTVFSQNLNFKNFIAHESCHCICETILSKELNDSGQDIVLRKLLGEAFAKTIEPLIILNCHGETHLEFGLINTYQSASEKTTVFGTLSNHKLDSSIEIYFLGLLLAMLNPCQQEALDSQFDFAIDFLDLTPSTPLEFASYQTLFNSLFNLMPGFRQKTNANYFKQIDLLSEYGEMIELNSEEEFNFIKARKESIKIVLDEILRLFSNSNATHTSETISSQETLQI